MKKFLQFVVVIFVLSSAAAGAVRAQERSWKTFSPEDGAWSILAPGLMRPDAEAKNPRSAKGSYSFNDFTGFFAVIYRDSPKRWVPWKPNYKAYFKKIRDDAVKAGKGQLLRDEEFSNGAASGREVFIKVPVGTITGFEGQSVTKYRVQRMRMFFHGKRFYLLLALLPESEVNAPEINRYFDSFAAK